MDEQHNHSNQIHDYLISGQVASYEAACNLLAAAQPNLPSSSDILPGEISPEQLQSVVTAFSDQPGLTARRGEVANTRATLQYVVPGFGVMERVGGAEPAGHKLCYKLTTPQGRQLAVLVVGYDRHLGMQVPQDRYITEIGRSPTRRTFEYSEAKTYFIAPIGNEGPWAVALQEWVGPSLADTTRPIALGLATLSRIRALRRISAVENLVGANIATTRNELRHPRNLLMKPGYRLPVVIDVPILQWVG